MMFETKPVRITELAKETEQYLLQKGCKKSTLGVYKATWHKFMAFSSSDVYSRTAAEVFLKLYFGVDIRDFLGHVEITTTEVYARIDAEMKRKVFEETVPNYIPEAVMPWEEDEDLLEWLTHFGKKTF